MKKVISYRSKNTERIDSFIKKSFPKLSKSSVLELLNSSKIKVNNKKVPKGYKLKTDDKIVITMSDVKNSKVKPTAKSPLKVLYKDEHILAVYKKRGIPTHPLKYSETNTLFNAILAKFPEVAKVNKSIDGGLINRLDNDTSGIVLAARTKEAFKLFKNLFKKKSMLKEYLALVYGKTDKEGIISFPIARSTRKKMKVIKTDKLPRNKRIFYTLTNYETVHSFKNLSFLKIMLTSAVTHQIRVHLASIGHPLVGDNLYNENFSADIELQGHFLHANSVEFKHPFTGKNIRISCTMDKTLTNLLDSLL